MSTTEPSDASILIASDNASDADQIRQLLGDRYSGLRISASLDRALFDFDEALPDVVLLAFDSLSKAERYCAELRRNPSDDRTRKHRKIVLCTAAEVQQAYEQCMGGRFDDYVLFWPLTNDSPRLAMAIHLALRFLAADRQGNPPPADFTRQAQRLASMEPMVENQMAQGRKHLEAARQTVAQAEGHLESAMDGLSSRLVNGELSDMVDVKDAAGLDRALSEMKEEKILQPLEAVSQAMEPLNQWAKNFKQQLQPHLSAAKSLGDMVRSITPVILVVDDDSFQRGLLRNILSEEKYKVVQAASARDAIGLLDKTRPNLILMDLLMPGMDGLEAVALIKSMPDYANLPIIMVTVKSDGNMVRDSLRAGAVDFIVKPVRPVALLAKVARALRPVSTLGYA